MQAALNLDSNIITGASGSNSPLSSVGATFSETGLIQVPIYQGGERVEEEIVDLQIKATIKQRGEYDQDPPIAIISDFVWNALTFQYDAEINWNIDTVLELLGIDSEPIDITGVALTDLITTASDHDFAAGDRVYFPARTGGTEITIGYGNWYYVLASGLTNDDFKVSATLNGAAVNFSTDISAGTVRRAPADVSSADLGLGLSWRRDSGSAWIVADNSVDLELSNSYPRETDGTPLSAGSAAADAWIALRAALYDRAQSLTGGQIAQALDNLGCSADVQSILGAADFDAIVALLALVIGADVQAWDADLDTWATVTPSADGQSLVSAANYAAMRALLTLVVGTDVQAFHANLTAFAALTNAANKLGYFNGTNMSTTDLTAVARTFLALATQQNQLDYMTNGLSPAQGDLFYFNGTNTAKLTAGTAGQHLKTNGVSANPTWEEVPLPRNYLTGFTLSNNVADATNDIDIAPGACRGSADAVNLVLSAATTKQLDAAWTAGSAAGGLDQGSIANAIYHLHAIRDLVNNLTDVIFSLSHDESAVVTMTIASPCVVTWGVANKGHGLVAGSPFKFSTTGALPTGVVAGTQYYVIATSLTETTFQFSATNGGSAVNATGSQSGVHTGLAGPKLPTGYTVFRCIGFVVRQSAALLPFFQDGDEVTLVTPVQDASTTSLSTARTVFTLATVACGLRLAVKYRAPELAGSAGGIVIQPMIETDAAPSSSASPGFSQGVSTVALAVGEGWIITNSLGQIAARSTVASTTLRIVVLGWRHRRGRDR